MTAVVEPRLRPCSPKGSEAGLSRQRRRLLQWQPREGRDLVCSFTWCPGATCLERRAVGEPPFGTGTMFFRVEDDICI